MHLILYSQNIESKSDKLWETDASTTLEDVNSSLSATDRPTRQKDKIWNTWAIQLK